MNIFFWAAGDKGDNGRWYFGYNKLTVSMVVTAISYFMFYFGEIFEDEKDFKEEVEDKLKELLKEYWQTK